MAFDSGAVSIIGSNVSGCSAGEVRRLELAASLQRRTAAGREIGGPRLPHPALSSQPQTGGVVMAISDNGAVSIIGSTVTSCSAERVRRVELAARLQRLTAAGRERWRGPRLPHPALLLATAERRRRLRGEERCGLANRLDRDELLCWLCAPRRATAALPAAPHGSGARGGCSCPPRSFLAITGRRRLREIQRCGLDNRLGRDWLLCWGAPRRAHSQPCSAARQRGER